MLPVRQLSREWFPNFFADFFDTAWPHSLSAMTPSVNVVEGDKEYEVEVAAPGLTKDDFKLHVDENGSLVINMERQKKDEEKASDGKRYIRREFSFEKFEQRLPLPDDVDREHIAAEVKDGILRIDLPKLAETPKAAGRAIEVL